MLIGIVVALIVLAVAIALSMCFGALAVATSAAMFLHQPFMYGWHQAWNRWEFLILFTFILLPFFAIRRSSK